MREIVNVHVGQAGLGVGASCWELLCLEHGILPNGKLKIAKEESILFSEQDEYYHQQSVCDSFFMKTDAGFHFPRALLVDLEPTVCDEIRKGPCRDLFHKSNIISGMEDGADNFARGYHSIGHEVIELIMDSLRRSVEKCSSLQGFIFYHATGGGTGSGLTSLILENLSYNYLNKKNITNFTINSSRQIGNSITEPYNSILSQHSLLEFIDMNINFDNESLYKIVSYKLNIQFPTYLNLNRLIAQVFSSITGSIRFQNNNVLNIDLNDMKTNLIPFPRLHSLMTCYSPCFSLDSYYFNQLSVKEMTNHVFQTSSRMLSIAPNLNIKQHLLINDEANQLDGKFISCCLLYKGDVTPKDVYHAIQNIKSNHQIRFVDWMPTGFKCSILHQFPKCISNGDLAPMNRSVCMIANHSGIVNMMARLNHKFDLMFAKKAFVHWYYSEGMEENEFYEAREDLAALEKDYEEVDGILFEPLSETIPILSDQDEKDDVEEVKKSIQYPTEKEDIGTFQRFKHDDEEPVGYIDKEEERKPRKYPVEMDMSGAK